jgi:citronellol/citronellal dehydrogenase
MSQDTSTPRTRYGMTDEEIAGHPTVYREDLFRGKVVLVSGAAGGIGRATAALFARLGATLELCGRDPDKLAQLAEALGGYGVPVHTTSLTIRDPDQVGGLIAAVWERHGRLDVQVNSAGGQFAQYALDFAPKGWNAVIDTNLNGTWYMMQHAALRWRDEGTGGNIINIVAVISRGLPGMAHTAAARAGVGGLSKTVATEWAHLGVRVNCIAPGTIETPAFRQYPDEGRATLYKANPLRRAGHVMDMAQACVYLAAETGDFITGELLHVDGGQQNFGDPWPAGRPDYLAE